MITTTWYLTTMELVAEPGMGQVRMPSLYTLLPPHVPGVHWGACDGPGLTLMALSEDDAQVTAPQSAAILAATSAAPLAKVIPIDAPLGSRFSAWANSSPMTSRAAAALLQQIPTGGTVRAALQWIARSNLLYQEVGFPPASATLATPMSTLSSTERTEMTTRMGRFPANVKPTATGTIGSFFLAALRSGAATYGITSGRARWGRPEANLGGV